MTNIDFVRQLRKNRKKAISPVIATIILIAVALVLALTVGVFAFGLFNSHANSVDVQGGALIASISQFQFSLHNPGASAIAVTSGTLSGQGITNGACTGLVTAAAGTNTAETCTVTGTLVAGDNYNYVISLANGQTISGVAVAQ